MKSQDNWSRRDFLRVSIAGAIGAGGFLSFSKTAEALGIKAVSRFTGLPLDAFPTTCDLCNSRCGILTFIKDGRLKGILGNPLDPETGGRICIRGLTGINLQEDPDRILYPMVRTGNRRGEGKWRRITWDEAYIYLAKVFQDSRRSFKRKNGKVILYLKNQDPLTERFLSALNPGGGSLILDGETNRSKQKAHYLTWGEGVGVPDISRSKTILNFGANPLVHHELYLPFVRRLIDRLASGMARLITFDVRLSETAGMSSEWFPISPGTDGHVILAMAKVIMDMGLHDRGFAGKWINCSEEVIRNHLAPYTPEMAGEISGISPKDIKRIAIEFAQNKPSVAFSGDGVCGHSEGTQAERAIILLNAIIGNIDQPGGYCLPKKIKLDELKFLSPSGEIEIVDPSFAMMEMLNGSFKADLLMIHMTNPAHDLPQSDEIKKFLESEESVSRLIVMDTHMSETASLADMVLPSATYLEGWGIESRPSMEMVHSIRLRQPVMVPMPDVKRLRSGREMRYDLPVTRPMGEAIQWESLLLNLSRRMGGDMERTFPFHSMEEYTGMVVSQIDQLVEEGGLSYLRSNGIWVDKIRKPPYSSYEHRGFKTHSGRLEIYLKGLEDKGLSPLPSFKVPYKISGSKLRLIPFRGLPSEGLPNAKWSAELAHDNPAILNKKTAERLGISDGGWIIISSGGEPVVMRVKTSEGIHPDVIAVSRGLGHRGYGSFAKGKRSKGRDPDLHLIWWGEKGNGTHIEPLVLLRTDPASGGQAWMETIVLVKKA